MRAHDQQRQARDDEERRDRAAALGSNVAETDTRYDRRKLGCYERARADERVRSVKRGSEIGWDQREIERGAGPAYEYHRHREAETAPNDVRRKGRLRRDAAAA